MYEWIKTDNDFANAMYRNRLVDDPVLASVVAILGEKGVVSQAEIIAHINERCQAVVSARENVQRED